MTDSVIIDQLELRARIGITDAERAAAQRLSVTLVLQPRAKFYALQDQIENAVDYKRVCNAVSAFAETSGCHLLETLAEQIAQLLLREFPLAAVEIELRKYVLPETNFVAVKVRREAGNEEQ